MSKQERDDRLTPEDVQLHREKLRIFEGIDRATERWTDVSAAAMESDTPDDLRQVLMTLIGLDDLQANAVLEMQVRRITRLDRERIASQVAELREELAEYDAKPE